MTGLVSANVIISSAHADITCNGVQNCPGGDFITGGGFIGSGGTSANFGVAGGIKNGGFWSHLLYVNHGTGIRVKGTGVTSYTVTDTNCRRITGSCEVNGTPAETYQVDVCDNGEPGTSDTFVLSVNGAAQLSGQLTGGNIQLHRPCKLLRRSSTRQMRSRAG